MKQVLEFSAFCAMYSAGVMAHSLVKEGGSRAAPEGGGEGEAMKGFVVVRIAR